MRQPLITMITTASAFSQCTTRSQPGWMTPGGRAAAGGM